MRYYLIGFEFGEGYLSLFKEELETEEGDTAYGKVLAFVNEEKAQDFINKETDSRAFYFRVVATDISPDEKDIFKIIE